ncbi:FN3 associated domain-containing protein [Flavihumibacter sp.]|uniref:FN3 associated domain-containing protein n=1 Tax=Flavihumibacter sp. TaxID=1913981 RepID=UPI002FCC2668
MRHWKNLLYNIVFAGNCLLFFLLLVEDRLAMPLWLQVVGRMHPLVLHFPVVLLLMVVVWEIAYRKRFQLSETEDETGSTLLLLAAAFTNLAALMGLMLSLEPGYEGDAILWHKWGGFFLSILSLLWYSVKHPVRRSRSLFVVMSSLTIGGLIITAHQGATITHGEDFLLAPINTKEEEITVSLQDAMVYDHVIEPILEKKCVSCHNTSKAKGELIMETRSALFKGGKSGILWDTTAKNFGLMMQRLHLPLEEKKHMPPKGKPQLTPEELSILYHWIKAGADTTGRLIALDPSDSLYILASSTFSEGGDELYTFDPASPDLINDLNDHYRVISPIAKGSPALQIDFYTSANYQPDQLEELKQIQEKVVSLNLSKMPVSDPDLRFIASFKSLRNLNISFTGVTDSGMAALNGLNYLRQLSLAGTKVSGEGIRKLSGLTSLQKIYTWGTKLSPTDLTALRKQMPGVKFETGFEGDTILMPLNPPIIENQESIIVDAVPLKLKHFMKGAEIRYTIDGSEPDSILSPVYKPGILLQNTLVVKTRAYKKGWATSATNLKYFYHSTITPDATALINRPDSLYRGNGVKTLFDEETGDMNFRSGKWLGFKSKPLELRLSFENPTRVSSFTVSTLVDTRSYIMPPASVELWGGNKDNDLKRLGIIKPPQPQSDSAAGNVGYIFRFEPMLLKYMKLIARPVPRLPSWHKGKGERSWVFADEIFIE